MIVLAIQVLGLLLVAAGFALLAPWAGLVVLGLAVLALGLMLESQKGGNDGPA